MKQYDLDWDGGSYGGFATDTDHPIIYCHNCNGVIRLDVDKYYTSNDKTIKDNSIIYINIYFLLKSMLRQEKLRQLGI